VLTVLEKFTTSEVALLTYDLLTNQALDLVLFSSFNTFHFELKAFHASHSMLALISSLPSAMELLMLEFEAIALTNCVFEGGAWAFVDPWSTRISLWLDIGLLLHGIWWQLICKCRV